MRKVAGTTTEALKRQRHNFAKERTSIQMTLSMRKFGRTGWNVSEIGFGAWAIGGAWGNVAEADAKAALNAALDGGVTFIDTADVYGDGRSERIIRDVLQQRGGERPIVATKLGRRLDPHVTSGYLNKRELEAFIDRSRSNLGVDTLDLVQLHCPPTEVYYRPEVFDAMDDFVADGKIRYYGVSVEKVEEALKAIEYPNVVSVQIIYNMFRQRPADLFFTEAKKKDVAVIARVPLASGMLTGKMSAESVFASDDHRAFNRHGEAFDVGETFSGVPYDVALKAVDELRDLVPVDASMAQLALRWILMEDAVSVIIPGSKNATQAASNALAASLAPLSDEVMQRVREVYQHRIAPHVHQRW
jgi:aryl-alcohol dehydrogenase-like predicted oxidoreductase